MAYKPYFSVSGHFSRCPKSELPTDLATFRNRPTELEWAEGGAGGAGTGATVGRRFAGKGVGTGGLWATLPGAVTVARVNASSTPPQARGRRRAVEKRARGRC